MAGKMFYNKAEVDKLLAEQREYFQKKLNDSIQASNNISTPTEGESLVFNILNTDPTKVND